MPDILLYGSTSLLYLLLGLHFWRSRWGAGGEPATASGNRIALWERIVLIAPFFLHSQLLYADLFTAPELRFGFSQALSVMLWLTVLIYWVESLIYDVKGMQALVLPLAAVCALLPAFFPGPGTPTYTHTVAFRIHLLVAMLAYSLFTIAALHAALMTVLERRLHRGKLATAGGSQLAGPWASLPPLMTLETLLFRLVAAGFVLLTLTLGTGFVFSEELFGRAVRFNHKTVFGIISWIIFAALLVGRYGWGWRGRTALRWTLAGFVALMLAYVGSMFVLEVILGKV